MTADVRHETGIQWTHVPGYIGATWNPTTGCTRVSPGCDHCYAFELHDQRFAANKAAAEAAGFTRGAVGERYIAEARKSGIKLPVKAPQYDVPFSQVQLLDEKRLTEPLRARKPRAYFVDSMADLFHEDVPDEFIDRVFGVMALTPQHIFMVLTKRPERMRAYVQGITDADSEYGPRAERIGRAMYSFDLWPDVSERGFATTGEWPLPNVWLGVSVEDQARADERIPWLLGTTAAVRFLSCEPLLGPVDLSTHLGVAPNHEDLRGGLHWVIAGGESGRHARPVDLAWARSLRDQCAAAGVPFFMKQLGARAMLPLSEAGSREWHDGMAVGMWNTKKSGSAYERDETGARLGFALRLRHSHGSDPEEWPEDLRVREWPEAKP